MPSDTEVSTGTDKGPRLAEVRVKERGPRDPIADVSHLGLDVVERAGEVDGMSNEPHLRADDVERLRWSFI